MRYYQLFTRILITTVILCARCEVSAKIKNDSLILQRIYDYQRANNDSIRSLQDNVYAKFRFNVEKRNILLRVIPSMRYLVKDPREYIRESYSKVTFNNAHDYNINSQVLTGTIRRNRMAMSALVDLMTPNIYDIALYEGHMLSPFNRHNRHYYRFSQSLQDDGTTRLDFRPKLYNTQLLNGYAIIETETGRIIKTLLNGEFDMISFRTEIQLGEEGGQALMSSRCSTAATFRFMGNRISALFDAAYHNPLSLPDTMQTVSSREMMDSIRPIPLSESDKLIYEAYDERVRQDSLNADSIKEKRRGLGDFLWNTIGDNLVTPIKAESEDVYLRISPIINPLYLSYSHSRGWRYKMKLRAQYAFSKHRYLTFNPTVGYNFKQKQLYFTAPLRMTYNPKRNGYAEIIVGNGNRISNTSVMNTINEAHQDTIDFEQTDADLFKDNHLQVQNNIMLFDWIDIETGFIYHERTAINKALMDEYGMSVHYRSFAPMIGIKLLPWLDKGPMFSIDFERGIKGVFGSHVDYELWEIDGSWKHKIPGLRLLNLRAGGGFYTNKENLFMDFANFRDENLPEGWDDDWSGNFQLLREREYNESDYYIRGNVSYESPLLFATWIPYLGRYIEKERLYISSVLLEKSRPYYEIGYGFTNRYISVGAFASFRNTHFDRIGVKFDFELFKRW